jgi:hypothetical protein
MSKPPDGGSYQSVAQDLSKILTMDQIASGLVGSYEDMVALLELSHSMDQEPPAEVVGHLFLALAAHAMIAYENFFDDGQAEILVGKHLRDMLSEETRINASR